MARVSVIIPTYNRAALLGEAIESVLAQSYQDFEIIVADDGSTDESAAVASKYGNKVRFLALPHRGQPAAPRNAGVAAATGEYISFLDSDDLYLPNKLALQVPALEENPKVGIVYSNAHFFVNDPTQIAGYVQDGLPTPSGDGFADLLRGNYLSTPIVLIRRTLVQEVGGFNEDQSLMAVEDYDLWLRLAMETELLFIPGDVAAIRRHAQNISRDTLRLRSRCLHILQELDQAYPDVMAAHPAARHEGYARQHGAIALAAWQQRQLGLATRHALQAASHTLQLPGGGIQAFTAWWHRRRSRAGSTTGAS